MSTCSLIEFRNNVVDAEHEFQNSWGGSARIWSGLFDRFCRQAAHDSWMMQADRLFALPRDSRLDRMERACLLFTFDYCLVSRPDFVWLADDLLGFRARYPVTGKSCHLAAWSKRLRTSDAQAIGLVGTSCGEDPWSIYDHDQDESRPYDLARDNKHWDLGQELAVVLAEVPFCRQEIGHAEQETKTEPAG